MTLDRRVQKLEQRDPARSGLPEIAFINFIGGGLGKLITTQPGPATIVGSDFGRIWPREGETENEFRRRVDAMKTANKRIEEMTDAELMVAMASADERISEELAEAGTVNDETLEGAFA